MRLHSTFENPLADAYERPGGAWDLPPLGELFRPGRFTGVALIDGENRLDHGVLDRAIQALAGSLGDRGVGRGDVVSWQLPNWYEAVMLYRACWLLGAIAVPLHHRLGVGDLKGVVDTLEPKVALCAPGLALGELSAAVPVRGGSRTFEEMLVGSDPAPHEVVGSDIAVGVLTSGSTGEPKVVLHSHRGLAYKCRVQQQVHALRSDDVVLMPAPLSHVSGLVNGVLLPAFCGMRTVLMDVWDPERALRLIESEKVTYMGGPAVFLTGMVESPEFVSARVTSLRLSSMGGSTMTPAALAALADRLGCTVKRAYGCTEAPTVTTMHDQDPVDKGRETDGRPVGLAEILVVDPANGTPHGWGEVGEIWLRGPEMFAGYAAADATAEAVTDDGWFRTGDLGVIDQDGWLTVAGRIKELIIRGGENIASAEIEAVLESHAAVRQAVVVGYPDPILGERVAAIVLADDGFDLDECRRWFAALGLAKFKTPEAVLRVESIPMLASGKPNRMRLKDYAAAKTAAQREQQ